VKSFMVGPNTVMSVKDKKGFQVVSDNSSIANFESPDIFSMKSSLIERKLIPKSPSRCVTLYSCRMFKMGKCEDNDTVTEGNSKEEGSEEEEELEEIPGEAKEDSSDTSDNQGKEVASNFGDIPIEACVPAKQFDDQFIDDTINSEDKVKIHDISELSSEKAKIQSLTIGTHVTAVLFKEKNFKGLAYPVTQYIINVSKTAFKDNLKSIALLGVGCVYLFDSNNYEGVERYELCNGVTHLKNAWGSNKVMSVIFGPKTVVEFYEKENFEGEKTVLTESFRNLKVYRKSKSDLVGSIKIINKSVIDTTWKKSEEGKLLPIPNCIALFKKANMTGESRLICHQSFIKHNEKGFYTKSMLMPNENAVWLDYKTSHTGVGTVNQDMKNKRITSKETEFNTPKQIYNFTKLKKGCALFFKGPDNKGPAMRVCNDSRNIQNNRSYFVLGFKSYTISENTEIYLYDKLNFSGKETKLPPEGKAKKDEPYEGKEPVTSFKSCAFRKINKKFFFETGDSHQIGPNLIYGILTNFVTGLMYGLMDEEGFSKIEEDETIQSELSNCIKRRGKMFIDYDDSDLNDDEKKGTCYEAFTMRKKEKEKKESKKDKKSKKGRQEDGGIGSAEEAKEHPFFKEFIDQAKGKFAMNDNVFENKQMDEAVEEAKGKKGKLREEEDPIKQVKQGKGKEKSNQKAQRKRRQEGKTNEKQMEIERKSWWSSVKSGVKKTWNWVSNGFSIVWRFFKRYYCGIKDKFLSYLDHYIRPSMYAYNVIPDKHFLFGAQWAAEDKLGLDSSALGYDTGFIGSLDKTIASKIRLDPEVDHIEPNTKVGTKNKRKRRLTNRGTPTRRKYRLQTRTRGVFSSFYDKVKQGVSWLSRQVRDFVKNYILPIIKKVKTKILLWLGASSIFRLGCLVKRCAACFAPYLTNIFYKLLNLRTFEDSLVVAAGIAPPFGTLIFVDIALSQMCMWDLYDLSLSYLGQGLQKIFLKGQPAAGFGYLGLGLGTGLSAFLGANPFIYSILSINSFHADLANSEILKTLGIEKGAINSDALNTGTYA